ncbi:DUF1804 family protein [Citrobacter braakii]|uniref:DUF1804 family protein n=1 Tax=Citrobacter braakii TaxID=57706 RepID=UPI003525E3F2
MAHPQEIRDKLRRVYVFDGLSLELAAVQIGIAYGTARRWKGEAASAGDDWDKLRAARLMAGGGLEETARGMLTAMVVQFQATMDLLTNGDPKGTTENIDAATRVKLLASLADAFNKAIASSRKILPETNQLAVAMQVIQTLSEFIKDNHPEHLELFINILEPFGRVIQSKFSGK